MDRVHGILKTLVVLALAVATVVLTRPTPAHAIAGEGEAWPAFTESSSCGAQRVSTPHAPYSGWLSRSELLRGDFAAMFGRTVIDVHRNLELWQIPGSTENVAVHPWVVPALEKAAEGLLAAQENDLAYRINPKYTYSTASRTIAGSLRISRHAYGTAFDINASKNPNRSDNKLITDIPDWWRQSFLDAGFCWGGLWIGSKDTMHFAWQGPAFSGYTELPLPYDPVTAPARFRTPDRIIDVEVPARFGTTATLLTDFSGNGALDIVRVRSQGPDLVLDTSYASRRHNACSAANTVVAGLGSSVDDAVGLGFGDWDGRGGQDLWMVHDAEGSLRLTVRWAFGTYSAETTATTDVPTPGEGSWISTADMDANGSLDLVIIEGTELTVWAIDAHTGRTKIMIEATLPFDTSGSIALGDADLDNLPDLWSIDAGLVTIALAADSYGKPSDVQRVSGLPTHIVDFAAADYDGDGRRDLVIFDGSTKTVWLGNTPMPDGHDPEVWFEAEEPECGEDETPFDRGDLNFTSSGWVAEGSYEWRRAQGFDVGCDPEDDDCEVPLATHTMVAEFFAWIDGLDAVPGDPSLAAVRALDRAGYDLWCPVNDTGCWSELIPAAEMSARFGMFLADRRDSDFVPHRWVLPIPVRVPADAIPQ